MLFPYDSRRFRSKGENKSRTSVDTRAAGENGRLSTRKMAGDGRWPATGEANSCQLTSSAVKGFEHTRSLEDAQGGDRAKLAELVRKQSDESLAEVCARTGQVRTLEPGAENSARV